MDDGFGFLIIFVPFMIFMMFIVGNGAEDAGKVQENERIFTKACTTLQGKVASAEDHVCLSNNQRISVPGF